MVFYTLQFDFDLPKSTLKDRYLKNDIRNHSQTYHIDPNPSKSEPPDSHIDSIKCPPPPKHLLLLPAPDPFHPAILPPDPNFDVAITVAENRNVVMLL
jgi:hypothetical protein